jgi:sugar phosphate isomerase/epimerase
LGDGVIAVGQLINCLEDAGYRGYYEYEVLGLSGPEACRAGAQAARDWFATLTWW